MPPTTGIEQEHTKQKKKRNRARVSKSTSNSRRTGPYCCRGRIGRKQKQPVAQTRTLNLNSSQNYRRTLSYAEKKIARRAGCIAPP